MTRGGRRLRYGPGRGIAVAALVWLALALSTPAAHAQSFATSDLAGTWRLFQLATPTGNVSQASIRSYSGQVTFAVNGGVTAGSITEVSTDPNTGDPISEDSPLTGGTLTLSAAGVLGGSIELDGGPDTLDVREARALTTKFTIVGASAIRGQLGLFTLVRLDATQTFSLNDDVANDGDGNGNYAYHEITPIDQGEGALSPPASPGEANWSSGSITFHADSGCTEADLMRADGTVRARRSDGLNSFG
jgi:hypothetical protein